MNKSEHINELATALSKFQGEVTDASKDKKGFGYNYSDLSGVLEIARPLMSKHGLSLAQFPGFSDGRVTVESVLMHSSGQWMASVIEMEAIQGKGMSMAQAIGSVITYARRYAASAMLGITQTDNDAAIGEIIATNQRKEITQEKQRALPEPQKTLGQPKITLLQKNILISEFRDQPDRMRKTMEWAGIQIIDDMTVEQYDAVINQIAKIKKEAENDFLNGREQAA